jgi:Na+/alanine symporter
VVVAQAFLILVIVGVALPLKIFLIRHVWRLNKELLRERREHPDPERRRRGQLAGALAISLLASIGVAFLVGDWLAGASVGAGAAILWAVLEVLIGAGFGIRDAVKHPVGYE